ncbi:MAG: alkaline phytoceramidase [Nitrosomonas sp.]|uniref:alkaline phytoceramidase n=1 Tax=Nitrosomonas sp. TaxID=42353 RepID=UPI00273488B9|nr:alkaline phytoceramidase [Nitrosomonas sp.]MDP3661914.1 alkaline phytoceramidase [Nitrosomonas sp.]MDZ4106243.1 alkaline phytoceramidase [Nitrosomonas sp.]
MKMHRQFWILAGITVLVVAAAMILPPIPQPAEYHQFADQRSFSGIPNFNDVISNLAFFLSGSAGLVFLARVYRTPAQTTFHDLKECLPYGVLFFSVTAAALGSMYYHWTPDVDHLMWDRLPIVIGIAALLSATLVDRISPAVGLWALPLLVVSAVFSVLHWYWTELQGTGNLNFYIVMQFYSILLIVWISLSFPSRYTRGNDVYQVIALYAIAKLAEILDWQIFVWTDDWISGHTLKHLIAAYAAYRIVQILRKRRFVGCQ